MSGPATSAKPAGEERLSDPAPGPEPATAPLEGSAPAPKAPPKWLGPDDPAGRRLRRIAPYVFLLVGQLWLVVVVIFPEWWAALPILSLWGIVGWRNRWFWAPLAGFLLGFGYWIFELLLLPAAPRGRLAAVIGAGLGTNATVALVIGPLLFGVLACLAALTVAGALRTLDDLWGPVRKPERGPTDAPVP
jgi:hypothetical protein